MMRELGGHNPNKSTRQFCKAPQEDKVKKQRRCGRPAAEPVQCAVISVLKYYVLNYLCGHLP